MSISGGTWTTCEQDWTVSETAALLSILTHPHVLQVQRCQPLGGCGWASFICHRLHARGINRSWRETKLMVERMLNRYLRTYQLRRAGRSVSMPFFDVLHRTVGAVFWEKQQRRKQLRRTTSCDQRQLPLPVGQQLLQTASCNQRQLPVRQQFRHTTICNQQQLPMRPQLLHTASCDQLQLLVGQQLRQPTSCGQQQPDGQTVRRGPIPDLIPILSEQDEPCDISGHQQPALCACMHQSNTKLDQPIVLESSAAALPVRPADRNNHGRTISQEKLVVADHPHLFGFINYKTETGNIDAATEAQMYEEDYCVTKVKLPLVDPEIASSVHNSNVGHDNLFSKQPLDRHARAFRYQSDVSSRTSMSGSAAYTSPTDPFPPLNHYVEEILPMEQISVLQTNVKEGMDHHPARKPTRGCRVTHKPSTPPASMNSSGEIKSPMFAPPERMSPPVYYRALTPLSPSHHTDFSARQNITKAKQKTAANKVGQNHTMDKVRQPINISTTLSGDTRTSSGATPPRTSELSKKNMPPLNSIACSNNFNPSKMATNQHSTSNISSPASHFATTKPSVRTLPFPMLAMPIDDYHRMVAQGASPFSNSQPALAKKCERKKEYTPIYHRLSRRAQKPNQTIKRTVISSSTTEKISGDHKTTNNSSVSGTMPCQTAETSRLLAVTSTSQPKRITSPEEPEVQFLEQDDIPEEPDIQFLKQINRSEMLREQDSEKSAKRASSARHHSMISSNVSFMAGCTVTGDYRN